MVNMARLRIDYPRRGRVGVRRWIPSFKLIFGTVFLGGALGAAVLTFLVMTTDIPAPNDVAQANTTIVYYADGRYEIGRIGDFNRVEVELAAIPLDVQRTVLAAEDKTFYEHSGFSLTGIGRAMLNNLGGNAAQGGSTITQQYAKNAYLSSERSITRKVKELVLSIKLETSTSKDEILNNYLNTVYFGRGAYGIQAAAKAYFGKDVSRLKIEQAAMLSALLKSPEGFAPEVDPDRLNERWNYVLDQMVDAGWLDSNVRAEMVFPEYKERRSGNRLAGPTGYILQEVKNDMAELGYDEAALGVAGFSIITTIDRTAQLSAEKAVEKEGPTTGTEGL
ncbi:MAG: Penicillin-binding protein, partial [Actinomycetota bacterium]